MLKDRIARQIDVELLTERNCEIIIHNSITDYLLDQGISTCGNLLMVYGRTPFYLMHMLIYLIISTRGKNS